MKLPILLMLVLIFLFQSSIAQTKDQVLKYKIYRADWTKYDRNISAIVHSVYYDSNANVIKEVEDYGKSGRNAVLYKYADTLLVEMIATDFYREEDTTIADTAITEYQYDKQNRLSSELMKDNSGEQTKKDYFYSDKGKIDTVFLYDNDSTVWTNKNPFVGEKRHKENVSLKKVQVYSYPDGNTQIIRECGYPVFDSISSCKTFKTISNDSLEIDIDSYYAREGCIQHSNESSDTTITHSKNGLVYLYENKVYLEKKYYIRQFNELGLVTERKAIDIYNGDTRPLPDEITYKYYFR